ncbi:methionine adenosyltransferase [Mycoplasma sp. 1018B]|uniref:methionine adenosyltransferase n=1 Tax=Mycoplasma sp. 1018B TaxID=2967302 RepID=UPI00211C5866|nr:methionine adenosyltransferase [Mycoplasma sp. 1018B]UUM19159.1 methionine adenosyltransferase [Mycoplasma sp. 1018B]
MNEKILFTSESVGMGHPDKLCDQISDIYLDAYLSVDPNAHVAIETLASANLFVTTGEIKVNFANKKIEQQVNNSIKLKIEHLMYYLGLYEWFKKVTYQVNIIKQSSDINQGVELKNGTIGAGDQGIMFGYATNETEEFMPLSIMLAHNLLKTIEKERAEQNNLSAISKWAKSDMKSQVTIDYSNNIPTVDTILLSIQHDENFNELEFKNYLIENIIKKVLAKYKLSMPDKILINPTGKFVIGGPEGDTGLTGRKIIVDTYGGVARHGGGAFSGKDATKVDRSAAYAARWIAKNLVAANILPKVEIQISYAIGKPEPTSIFVETFNYKDKNYTNKIQKCIRELFDLTPAGIIKSLNLNKPIFSQTAVFGHFGRNDDTLPWEKLNMVEKIKNFFEKNN